MGGGYAQRLWRRNMWIIIAYWAIDLFGAIALAEEVLAENQADFFGLSFTQYLLAIPAGILVNTLGCGLPVIVMMHVIFLSYIVALCPADVPLSLPRNKLTTIAFAGFFYAIFSLFDQGVDYSDAGSAFMSVMHVHHYDSDPRRYGQGYLYRRDR